MFHLARRTPTRRRHRPHRKHARQPVALVVKAGAHPAPARVIALDRHLEIAEQTVGVVKQAIEQQVVGDLGVG